MTICTRCQGTGFLNIDQIDESVLAEMGEDLVTLIPLWIEEQTDPHNVQICDCCGDGDSWRGEPGRHYGRHDPPGRGGPYAYNGGLCECH